MITLRNELDVNRSIDHVFNFIVNVENAPKWQPAVIETRRLTDGPIRVGSQFREVAKMMGRRVETVCEITALEPRVRVAFRGTSNGPISYATTYTLAQRGHGTRIVIEGSFELKGLWRFVERLLQSDIRKESAQELKAMQAALERE